MVEVSVVMAAYNVAHYLPRAIESALTQEGVSVEVIVVDDASTDATLSVLAGYKDPRVKVIRREKNAGAGAARNEGLSQAKGTWIAVLDGDDVFLPGRLKRLVAMSEDQQLDIVADNLEVHRESDSARFPMFSERALAPLRPLTPEAFISGNSNFIQGYGLGYLKPFLRRDFLTRHGLWYRESIRIGEDYLFLLSALAQGARCHVISTPGYGYTARVGSTSYRLTYADVERCLAEDEVIFSQYAFDAAARAAQRVRRDNLYEALHYQNLVSLIQSRQWEQAFLLAWKEPLAARHLWLPLAVRLRRLMSL